MARKEVIQIRCSDLEKQRWKEIASSQHLELSSWIRLTLGKAAALQQAQATLASRPNNQT